MSRYSIQCVPPEIIDHVFSFLQSYPNTLTNCSRAHPNLSLIAERFLYADVVVSDTSKDKNDLRLKKDDRRQIFTAAKFHKLLIDSPHIANYVRKLEINLSSRPSRIAPILPMLMRLDAICVAAEFYRYWSDVPETFRDAFMERLLSPLSILKEVSVIRFKQFPLRILDGCKTVRHIGLQCWGMLAQNNPQVPPHHALDSLSLRTWELDSEFMEWASKHIHYLQFLLFDPIESRTINEMLPKLLKMCSTTLRSLEVKLPCDGYHRLPECIKVDLSSVPHLKDITIRSNINPIDEYCCLFPAAVLQILETAPHLDNLILKFTWPHRPLIYNAVDWSPLLGFLSRSSHKFRHIELQHSARFIPSIDTIPSLYESEIVSDLMAKGILDICSEKWSTHWSRC